MVIEMIKLMIYSCIVFFLIIVSLIIIKKHIVKKESKDTILKIFSIFSSKKFIFKNTINKLATKNGPKGNIFSLFLNVIY